MDPPDPHLFIWSPQATGLEFACKMVPLAAITTPQQMEALMQEAEIMLHLRGRSCKCPEWLRSWLALCPALYVNVPGALLWVG